MKNPKIDESDRADWYGVEDLRIRKRVQDRLAQRARRKRLAEASKDGAKSVVVTPKRRRPPENAAGAGREPWEGDVTDLPKRSKCQTQVTVPARTVSARETNHRRLLIRPPPGHSPPLGCTTQPMVDPTTKVIMALHANGLILGLCCNNFEIITSPAQPPTSAAPAILHPSALQRAVPHFDWIDRFPFPKFRDNAIMLADSVDLAEFVSDFYTMKPFALREGGSSWDPCTWLVDPRFHAKWGFLFN